MANLIKSYNEGDMLQMLSRLQYPEESIEAAVYCVFMGTGFFASAYDMIPGYIAVTNANRLIGFQIAPIKTYDFALELNSVSKRKISKGILGSRIIYLEFADYDKSKVRFQVSPRISGKKFPNQPMNLERLVERLGG